MTASAARAMAVAPARRIAFEVLRRVEAGGAYASDVLHAELVASVKPADAGLATELSLGVLRWRRLLDFLLERHIKKPVDRLDLPVALALRMGAYQLRFLERIPARAAVNESVEMVKSARKSSAASLVNAVLRRMAASVKSPVEKMLPSGIGPAERLGILHSHPTWMVERWLTRLGEPRTIELLQANNRSPRLSCAVHDSDQRDAILRALGASGLDVAPGRLLRGAFAVSGGSVARTAAFLAGKISVQDEASQSVPMLLDARPGDRVLDLCAAPGGKTPALARAAGRAGMVIAADRHAHRLGAMQSQFKRLGLRGVHLVELDATESLPFRMPFDRILVDAPCSGTGTLARHPEIRWRLRRDQLVEFHALQVQMLRVSLAHLNRGGRLVYSTCSIEPEENEEAVAEVLRNAPEIRRVPTDEATGAIAPHLSPEISAPDLFDEAGQFHIFPGTYETDGFFAAILQRD
jgi:16S rRNA (cytosine967-C5)-methyltransferase